MSRMPSASFLRKAGLGVRMVGASVLGGVLVAALALPTVGLMGLGVKAAVGTYNAIPDDFTAPALDQARQAVTRWASR